MTNIISRNFQKYRFEITDKHYLKIVLLSIYESIFGRILYKQMLGNNWAAYDIGLCDTTLVI